jgi:hypothetical protein
MERPLFVAMNLNAHSGMMMSFLVGDKATDAESIVPNSVSLICTGPTNKTSEYFEMDLLIRN